jgi:hypothetical protein
MAGHREHLPVVVGHLAVERPCIGRQRATFCPVFTSNTQSPVRFGASDCSEVLAQAVNNEAEKGVRIATACSRSRPT